jgi:hypothetical protein
MIWKLLTPALGVIAIAGRGDTPPPDEPDAGPEDGIPGEPDPVELPVDGALDLHTFHPKDVKELVPEYLLACRERGILEVRIIHGKGTGALRRTVHAVLDRLPEVLAHRPAGEGRGGWGATLVVLRPLEKGGSPGGPPG